MKIRNGTLMKGSLPALATAFLCTSGAQGQVYNTNTSSYIGTGYTVTGSVMLTNNTDTRVTMGQGTCVLPTAAGHWFDLSDPTHGLDAWYATVKGVNWSFHSSNNPGPQPIHVILWQDLTPLTSDGTCHATTFPGPDEASLLLLWEDETIIPPSSASICSFGDCVPRADGDRSMEFEGPTGGGILLDPDLTIFVEVGHLGEATTRLGFNIYPEVGDGVGGPAGNAQQTWYNGPNCSAGGCGSFDWVTQYDYDDTPRNFVLTIAMEPGDDTNPGLLSFCPEDFTGSTPGEPDGAVNVLDLLQLLDNWGELAPPRPLGDIAPLFNGDNTVNVLDLLGLLAAWGDCPIPYADCAALLALPPEAPNPASITGSGTADFHLDGSFLDGDQRDPTNNTGLVLSGNGTNFWFNYGAYAAYAPGIIQGPWDGDPGPFYWGDTFGIDMGIPGPGIFDPNLGVGLVAPPYFPGGDAWFLYTADCNGAAIFSIDSSCGGGAIIDSVMEIYPFTGSCPIWQDSFAWGDDEFGGCSGRHAQISINVLEDEQYLVRLGGWAADSGTGTLTYECRDNSFCVASIAIDDPAFDYSITGNTSGAAIEGPISCAGLTQSYGGRWYSVVGDGNTMTASTCATAAFEDTNPETASLFDSMLSVYCATLETDCEDLTCVASHQGDFSCNLHETVSWCARDGQVYYILVHGNPGVPDPINGPFYAEGFFVLDVTTDESACVGALACGVARPFNDRCENAGTITPDIDGGPGDVSDVANGGINEPDGLIFTEVSCNNVNATQDGHTSVACANTGDDIWFTYTANVFLSEVVFSTCNDAFYDTKIEVHDPLLADCPTTSDDSLITCSNDDSGCGGFTTRTDPIIAFDGDSFLIRVGSPNFGTQEGTGTLTVEQTEIFTLCPDPCPGTAYVESELLLDDGDEDSVNGGCNMCTPLYDALLDVGEANLGQACGQISTFVTEPDIDPCDLTPDGTPIDMRDTDWYEINVPDLPGPFGTQRGGRVTITLASEFPGVFGVVGACDGGAPAVETPFLYSEVSPGICFPVDLTVDLETGTYYVVVTYDGVTGLEVGGDGVTHDGHDYILSVGAYEPAQLPPLNDECVDAITVLSNSSTDLDNRWATNDGADPLGLACWYTTVGQYGTVWYKFVATDTTATVSTCVQVSGGDTSIGVFSGTCGSLVEIGCAEDECAPFLSTTDLTGLTASVEYYIMVAGWSAGDRDVYQLDLSSP